MGQLEVFDTRGNRIHPTRDKSDSNIASYFERFVFGMQLNASQPQLEAYARMVLGEGGREQVFIRYTGDNPNTLIHECREAVQRELLDNLGWRLVEHDGPSDPRALFYTLMQGTSGLAGRQNELADWFRPLVQNRKYTDIAANWVTTDENVPVKVYARDYQTIAEVIPEFLGQSIHLFVGRSSSRERRGFQSTTDDSIDIELLPNGRQTNGRDFTLHGDTKEQFETRWEEQRERVRQEKYDTIRTAIGELSSLSTDANDVLQNVNQAFNSEYPTLQVTHQQQQNEVNQGVEPRRRSAGGGHSSKAIATSDDSSRRFSGLKTVGILVALLLVVIASGLSMGWFNIPGGNGKSGFQMDVSTNGNMIVVNGSVKRSTDTPYNISIYKNGAKLEHAQLNFSNTTSDSIILSNMSAGRYEVKITTPKIVGRHRWGIAMHRGNTVIGNETVTVSQFSEQTPTTTTTSANTTSATTGTSTATTKQTTTNTTTS